MPGNAASCGIARPPWTREPVRGAIAEHGSANRVCCWNARDCARGSGTWNQGICKASRWIGAATERASPATVPVRAVPSPFDVDKDNDNRITPPELQAHFPRLFSRFDRDRDGAISRAEALTIRTTAADANGPTGPLRPKGERPRDRT